jgi:hypothetical protein
LAKLTNEWEPVTERVATKVLNNIFMRVAQCFPTNVHVDYVCKMREDGRLDMDGGFYAFLHLKDAIRHIKTLRATRIYKQHMPKYVVLECVIPAGNPHGVGQAISVPRGACQTHETAQQQNRGCIRQVRAGGGITCY